MPKPIVAPILGPRLRLRPLEAADLPMTLAWRNRDEVRRWFVHSERLTPEQHEAWFLQYLRRDDDHLFLIEETDRLRKAVGQVGLYEIDRGARSAVFGRLLIGEPEARGDGLARDATALLLGFAFGPWGLRTIDLEVFAENRPALRVYRRCGFEPTSEGGGLVRMRVTPERFARAQDPADDPPGRRSVA